jgi:2-methylcitrate dehydratase PrpD
LASEVPNLHCREVRHEHSYRTALLDWLACAVAGAREPAVAAARADGDGLLDRVAAAGTAGHVLDYDDTYAPGVIHLSAPVAPAALVLAAALDATTGDALSAYAEGFEAAGALARASHPRLYDRGWHPTSVCGTVGAAVAAARLLGLGLQETDAAAALALLRAGGLRAAFGSDGKALQVGLAAAAGVGAARLIAAGARVPLGRAAAGFEQAFGGRWASPDPSAPAIAENWIKPYPCCLATHSTIEAMDRLRATSSGVPPNVVVHPLARQAAALDDVNDGLEAKFSIPYLAAYTLLHGPPTVASFARAEPDARALGAEIEVRTDARLGEWEARIEVAGDELARIETALGSPARPLDGPVLERKLRDLAGDRLDGALDDLNLPAHELLRAAGL